MSDAWLDLRLLFRRIGYFRLVSAGLLLSICLAYFVVTPRLDQEVQMLRQQASSLRELPVVNDQDSLLHDRYHSFLDRLPHLNEKSATLKALFKVSSAQGISLSQADYQLQHNDLGGYYRLRISLPVMATYPKFRVFLDNLLEQVPSASIDEVVLHRETVNNPVVSANLKLSIFFKDHD